MDSSSCESSSMKVNIRTRIEDLQHDDRMCILHILTQYVPVKNIIENADGCRVNLDILSDMVIEKLNHIINNKLKNLQSNII